MIKRNSVVIIGAGLSGLFAAWKLHRQGREVIVLEARERTGGRILSSGIDQKPESCIDLGPAWVWPQFQTELYKLISELEIKIFKQFTSGDILYESANGQIERHAGPSSHEQSYRISGGCISLIEGLQSRLPASSIRLNTEVTSIDQQTLTIHANCNNEDIIYKAEKIILTIPPRLINQSITFNPPLDEKLIQLWKDIPTWMAGQCKIVFIYKKPFWREQGLSAEVFSHCGPLTEIYDGSPSSEAYFALTSFVGFTAQTRREMGEEKMIELCLAHLQRLFGEEGLNVLDIQVKDWSKETYTATEKDLEVASGHPQYPLFLARSSKGNNIIFAGTETAANHGGYLEGALESIGNANI